MREQGARYSVVLADDHPAILRVTAGFLAAHFNVLAEVTDGRSAVEAVAKLNPDIAVLDILMPELDGIAAAREILKIRSGIKIVVLTIQNDMEYLAAALEAGASAYVLKSRMRTDLLLAIDHALSNTIFVSPHPKLLEQVALQPRHI